MHQSPSPQGHRRPAPFVALALCLLVSTSAGANAQQGGVDPADPKLRVPIEHWGCSNCHLPGEAERGRIDQRPGPDLTNIGSRASSDWLKRWIERPASLRAAPTMPRLFGNSTPERTELAQVVHFLASLGEPAGGEAATEEIVLDAGRRLYHEVGCVACHGPLASPAEVYGDEFQSPQIPQAFVFSRFSDLTKKWFPAALSSFLLAPGEVHLDGRMPAMDLGESEADLIANYLLSVWGPAKRTIKPIPALVKRGEEIYAERGCQACHTIEGREYPVFEAPSLAEISAPGARKYQGCLSGAEWDGPRYDFPAPPLLMMFMDGLAACAEAEITDPELDYLARRIERLNCRACHELDGAGGWPPGALGVRPFARRAHGPRR